MRSRVSQGGEIQIRGGKEHFLSYVEDAYDKRPNHGCDVFIHRVEKFVTNKSAHACVLVCVIFNPFILIY